MSELNVLIPGYFSSIQPYHLRCFEEIKTIVSSKNSIPTNLIYLHFLILPQYGFDPESVKALLDTFSFCKSTSIYSDNNILDEILSKENINGLIVFDPNPFDEWPPSRSKKSKNIPILEVHITHPDIIASDHLFKRRFSPSTFLDKPVNDEILKAALESARRSPSAGNLQAYSIISVKDRNALKTLADISHHQDKVAESAGAFVFIIEKDQSAAKYKDRGRNMFALQDATIACSHLQLALESFGVQSRWIGAFRNEDMQKALNLGKKEVASLLIYGYGEKSHHKSSRRALNDYVSNIDH